MLKYLVLLVVISAVAAQTWVSRARLENHEEYWVKVMQELIDELEKREWCNLKLDDITQTINDNLYHFQVSGTVRYTNGFVVSIQKIDIVQIEQIITTRTVDGESVPFATVRGRLNFRDIMVGHDVEANLTSPEGIFRSTGTYLHTLVQMQLDVTQNLITKEMTSSPFVLSVTAGSGVRMQYLPSNNVTEALGRRFWASTFDSAGNWGRNIFTPIILDIATNKIEFPEICFNNCS